MATDNAGSTAAHLAKITASEGKRLTAFDGQRRKQSLLRQGINTAERRQIVEMLRRGDSWRDVAHRYRTQVAADALEAERTGLEAEAGKADEVVLPDNHPSKTKAP